MTSTDLAGLLAPQEIFPQSGVITDTPLLREFPCETHILRDTGTCHETSRLIRLPGFGARPGVGLVVDLGKVLKIKVGIDLRGADIGVSQQFLDRT